MHAQDMISSHPQVRGSADDKLTACIEACFDCAQVCTICADACLAEEMVQDLRQCIRLNLDCADLCAALGTIASRRTGSNPSVVTAVLRACEEACARCAEECGRHAEMHDHCRICAETCRECAQACQAALQTFH